MIRTEQEYNRALAMIDDYMHLSFLTPIQDSIMLDLVDQVEKYECEMIGNNHSSDDWDYDRPIPEEVYVGLEQAKQGLGRKLSFDLDEETY